LIFDELLSVRAIDPEQLLHQGSSPRPGRIAKKIFNPGGPQTFPRGFIGTADPIHPLQDLQFPGALTLIMAVRHGRTLLFMGE
jgi:hypothetical protein